MQELERVREQNVALDKQTQQLLSINSQLRESNLLLEGKCETLLEDLSVKEAQWSEKEDRLTAEVSVCMHGGCRVSGSLGCIEWDE